MRSLVQHVGSRRVVYLGVVAVFGLGLVPLGSVANAQTMALSAGCQTINLGNQNGIYVAATIKTFFFAGDTITITANPVSGRQLPGSLLVSVNSTPVGTTPIPGTFTFTLTPAQTTNSQPNIEWTISNTNTVASFTVTCTNKPAATATLKVCKVAGTPVIQGTYYSFSVNGGPLFSIPAGPAPGICLVVPGSFTVGLAVNVQESLSTSTQVSAISSTGPVSSSLATGSADVTINAGVTVVTFTNVKKPTGYLEICKKTIGLPTNPPKMFGFRIPGVPGIISIPGGFCSGPIQVPAGQINVHENPLSGWTLVSCASVPPSSPATFCPPSKSGGTATVTVAVGGIPTETRVTFTNLG